MVVRHRPSALRLFFIPRGAILPRIRMHLAVSTLLALVVTWTDGQLGHHKLHFTTAELPPRLGYFTSSWNGAAGRSSPPNRFTNGASAQA